MKIKTIEICQVCLRRIEYDTDAQCYLRHDHLLKSGGQENQTHSHDAYCDNQINTNQ